MSTQPEWVFEAADYEGTPMVVVVKYVQEATGRRGYVVAVGSPDLVFQSSRDERSRIFYRLDVGRGEFAGKHVVVVVKYVQEATGRRGYVGTMYLSRAVYSRGVQLWPRMANVPQ